MNTHTVLGGDHAFDSDEVGILVLAYENALRELRLADRETQQRCWWPIKS
jgi:hypothetical protein